METIAEQYYPTYKAAHRDVLLEEFQEAQKIANGQSKLYGQVTNVLIAIATLSFTFFLNSDAQESNIAIKLVSENSILFCTLLFVFGSILLRYFVDLQKQITINARKVVTLRVLLGLDYGRIHLTIPNWRVEGATNPFVIKYFNGWFAFKTMPFWVVAITVNIAWWLTIVDKSNIKISFDLASFYISWHWGHLVICAAFYWIFRRNLNDRHETVYLNIVKIFCWIFRFKLSDNFEYILYRSKLSYIELDRLNVNYQEMKIILVNLEDRTFNKNMGISVKALVRGLLSRHKFFRKKYKFIVHGGSTITMQLARSSFIPSNQNKYLRKIVEIMLSLWLNKQFTKPEIIKLYISSVRYERGILGLANAVKHFFGDIKSKTLSKEESFFLVERLSNVTSSVNWQRIEYLSKKAGVKLNEESLKQIYLKQISNGKLRSM